MCLAKSAPGMFESVLLRRSYYKATSTSKFVKPGIRV